MNIIKRTKCVINDKPDLETIYSYKSFYKENKKSLKLSMKLKIILKIIYYKLIKIFSSP